MAAGLSLTVRVMQAPLVVHLVALFPLPHILSKPLAVLLRKKEYFYYQLWTD